VVCVEQKTSVVPARIGQGSKTLGQSQNEESHGVNSEGNRWVALLDFQVRVFVSADALRHHSNGQGTLAPCDGDVSTKLGDSLAQS
jgi:hypothetical protein